MGKKPTPFFDYPDLTFPPGGTGQKKKTKTKAQQCACVLIVLRNYVGNGAKVVVVYFKEMKEKFTENFFFLQRKRGGGKGEAHIC